MIETPFNKKQIQALRERDQRYEDQMAGLRKKSRADLLIDLHTYCQADADAYEHNKEILNNQYP